MTLLSRISDLEFQILTNFEKKVPFLFGAGSRPSEGRFSSAMARWNGFLLYFLLMYNFGRLDATRSFTNHDFLALLILLQYPLVFDILVVAFQS